MEKMLVDRILFEFDSKEERELSFNYYLAWTKEMCKRKKDNNEWVKEEY